ncbi:protein adenylyltransferase SelO [Pelomonas sp. SE-A7]|uniref:protein adenylyltransferase SelO n=1 Tax=Pelomonas sp. SE-A7 TaxID=3054953 RepID=UPI00259D2CC1|nr:YdiU family protein [Pelomonas sp. SE-A7]MDM4766066.1 YdiU family protein [Pelomonas sp. SE-A7]
MHVFPGLTLSRSPLGFSRLGPEFLTELPPEPAPAPHWVAHSEACAQRLGLGSDWRTPQALELLSGNGGESGWASVYSGHQFGVWAGQLGDGRALHVGEIEHQGQRYELQLKGAGRTPYSRMGDGRAVLRSSIREFLCSEAMAALAIPTTRALCITGSPLRVRREEIETAAIVTRVAPSFLRFGHFEHFAHHDLLPQLAQLFEHVLDRHAPECREAEVPAAALLEKVSRQTASLMADWQAVGFMHGVMNTDNMSLLGLTLDYGPFGFMDGFDPGHICNHSDHQGRYAYARQPNVAFWNLHALAQALIPLVPGEPEKASEPLLAALESYREAFPREMLGRLRAKLGLLAELPQDRELADDWLKLLAAGRTDFTIAWRHLARFDSQVEAENAAIRDLFLDREAFDAWARRYRERLLAEASLDAERGARMNRVNPAVVLRNHLAEGAIRSASEGDFGEIERLLKVLERPYDEPVLASDAALPPDWAAQLEVSCSS